MAGVVHEVSLDSAAAQAALARLSPELLAELVDDIGSMVKAQTEQRIDVEKTDPDGKPWASWSQRHAERLAKKTARSLLVGEGDLRDSLAAYVTGTEVRVGTNLPYGAIHQFGGDVSQGHPPIPARPYLGLSVENATEIENLLLIRVEEVLR
jgi:phage virion morphogenesis protein